MMRRSNFTTIKTILKSITNIIIIVDFLILPTSTKCNLSPIQTNQLYVQLSLQLRMTELSFPSCNIIIMCSKFTVTINISGFSPHAHNERNRQNPFLIT